MIPDPEDEEPVGPSADWTLEDYLDWVEIAHWFDEGGQ